MADHRLVPPGRTALGIPDELRLLLTDSVRERMTRLAGKREILGRPGPLSL